MKYKVHDLDESKGNPFKIGDRVNMLGVLESFVVKELTKIKGETFLELHDNDGTRVYSPHWRHCRLVTPIKPVEIHYCLWHDVGAKRKPEHGKSRFEKWCSDTQNCEWKKFREVLE